MPHPVVSILELVLVLPVVSKECYISVCCTVCVMTSNGNVSNAA